MIVRALEWRDWPGATDLYLALYQELPSDPLLGIHLHERPPTRAEEATWFGHLCRQIWDGDAVATVAEDEGTIVGLCVIGVAEQSVEVRSIGILGVNVARGHRGRGVGRALLEHALDQARVRFRVITLSVIAENSAGLALYTRLGFREWGRLPKGFQRGERWHELVRMWRELEPPPGPTRVAPPPALPPPPGAIPAGVTPVVRAIRWTDFAPTVGLYLDRYREVATNPALGVFTRHVPPTLGEEAEWFADLQRRILEQKAFASVLEVGDGIGGLATVDASGDHVEDRHVGVLGIAIADGLRGQGFGRRLLDHVLAQCRVRFAIVTLNVLSSNDAARKLYAAAGFRDAGTVPAAFVRGGRAHADDRMWIDLRSTAPADPRSPPN
ncbi:MAG TPA: GNAT family N-acetyltransferase [Thermoplasmata archaeon]|nr:GNAT family N-acetyltransferase [Thermoplasmata archaeon]